MNLYYFLDVEGCMEKHGVEPIEPFVKHTGIFGDAGVDLFSPVDIVVPPFSYVTVDSFVGFIFDPGVAALMFPRGGDTFLLGSGVIDTGYTGTIVSKIVNPYSEPIQIVRGGSIGQIVPFVKAQMDGIDLRVTSKPAVAFEGRRNAEGRIRDGL